MKTATKTAKTTKRPRILRLIWGDKSFKEINFIRGFYQEGVNGTMYPIVNTYRRACRFIVANPNTPFLTPFSVAKNFGLTLRDFDR